MTNTAATKPRPRTVKPNTKRRDRMKRMPRQRSGRRLAGDAGCLEQDDRAHEDEQDRQRQRKAAGAIRSQVPSFDLEDGSRR